MHSGEITVDFLCFFLRQCVKIEAFSAGIAEDPISVIAGICNAHRIFTAVKTWNSVFFTAPFHFIHHPSKVVDK